MDGSGMGCSPAPGPKRHGADVGSRRPRWTAGAVSGDASTRRTGWGRRPDRGRVGTRGAPLPVFGCARRVPVQSLSPTHPRSVMSLWTPGGEHEVPREPAAPASEPESGAEPRGGPSNADLLASLSPEDRARLESLSPEEQARAMAQLREMAEEMVAVQRQMAEAPAAVVVANHAMGIYELATIHLRQQPPNLPEAKVAIDAFAALLEALRGRLGPDEPTLEQALQQIRMAFVQLQNAAGGAEPGDEPGA